MKQEEQITERVPAVGKRSLRAQFRERYAAWSAPMRFLFWLGLGLILYFGVIEAAFAKAREYGAAADASAQLLVSVSKDSRSNREQIIRARKHWGLREIPAGGQGSTDLQKVINKVLEAHGVTVGVTIKDIGTDELKVTARGGARRKGGARAGDSAKHSELVLSQTKTQVQFSAAPDVVSAVLSDLEKDPTVACIQRVSLSRNQARNVLQVTLVAQSWRRK